MKCELPYSVFTTQQLEPNQRLAVWKQSLAVLYDFKLNQEIPKDNFSASLENYLVGNLMFSRCKTQKAVFSRTEKSISTHALDHIVLQYIKRGSSTFQSHGNSSTIHEGEIRFQDLSKKHTLSNNHNTESLFVIIPRYRLEPFMNDMDQIHGFSLNNANPTTRLLQSHLLAIWDNLSEMDNISGNAIIRPFLELIRACINNSEEMRKEHIQNASINQIEEIKSYIAENLMNPELHPESISNALNISRSKMYRLFTPIGGLAKYIRTQRLKSSYRDLTDPSFQDWLIIEIACKWGFDNVTTFSRAFKSTFGMTPKEVRKQSMDTVQDLYQEAFLKLNSYGKVDRSYEHWLKKSMNKRM